MITRNQIIEEARSWAGTKWQHQARLKGVAADCVGFVKGVDENLTGVKIEETPDYVATWHLFKSQELLYETISSYPGVREILPIENRKPGDVLLFRFGKGPAHHVGILTSDTTFMHSYAEVGQVVEVNLDDVWIKRIAYVFEFPEVVD